MNVYAGAENIITSLGFNSGENIERILAGDSGIAIDRSGRYSPEPLPLSHIDHERAESLFKEICPASKGPFTPLEKLFILSITHALRQSRIDISSAETGIIFSSTKGNIDLLQPEKEHTFGRERIYLHEMARTISACFGNPNTPIVLSNACVSGVLALVYAERLIRAGKYKNMVVSGGDLMSEFIVSGFQSFQSLSSKACKPFDKERDGLNIGEGCGTLILSSAQDAFNDQAVKVLGGAGSNDANHISGPSRTGEGLYQAIRQTMKISGLKAGELDSISAHGTATNYNDEMEAKAFSRCGMEAIPLNSYKGYIGHTLGAAGVIESALSLQSMKRNMLFRSAGYTTHGVSTEQNIIREHEEKEITNCLKTGSGFGGSNAAILFQKI